MCSACTSSSPSAVNSAAEQSARSLMFGLNAARRSTAPISSATPSSRYDEHLQRSRIERHAHRSITNAPASPTRARPAGGTQIVQSGSAMTAGPSTRACVSDGGASASTGDRRLDAGACSEGDDLDRRVGPRVAVAAGVLVVEVVDACDRELVALSGVADVEERRRHRVRRRRVRAASAARRLERDVEPVDGRRRRPRAHELALAAARRAARPRTAHRRAPARRRT